MKLVKSKQRLGRAPAPAKWLAMAAGLSASAVQLQALEPDDLLIFSRGPVSIRPQLRDNEIFNDNIFFNEHHRVDDLISVVSPGVNFVLGREMQNPLPAVFGASETGNYLEFDYQFDHFFYADNSRLDTNQHLLDFKDRYDWSRVHLLGADSIHFLSGIFGQGEQSPIFQNDIASTAYRDDYTLTFDATDKTHVYARGVHWATDYQHGLPLYSINDLSAILGFEFKAFPRLGFFGEGYYGQTAVPRSDPSLPPSPYSPYFGGFIGARGYFTQRLVGTVKAGYEDRELSNGQPGVSAPVVEAAISEQFSDKTSVTLNYTRHTYLSVQFNSYPYTGDTVGAEVDQIIGRTGKLTGRAGGNYLLYGFAPTAALPRGQEQDYHLFAALSYNIQLWLRASLGYDYENFTTDLPGLVDYHVNRVTLALSVGY